MGNACHTAESRDGSRWLVGALLVAIAFTFFLNAVDDRLTFSDKEARLGATLRELRSAQTALGIRGVDDRLSAAVPQSAAVPEEEQMMEAEVPSAHAHGE